MLSTPVLPLIRPLGLLLAAILPSAAVTAQVGSWAHPDGSRHWYQVVHNKAGVTWSEANAAAAAAGGYLATATSAGENDYLFTLVDSATLWTQTSTSQPLRGPWIGGLQAPGATEPLGGWHWNELEGFSWAAWATGSPTKDTKADRVHYLGTLTARAKTWGDAAESTKLISYIIEYSGPFTIQTVGLMKSKSGSFEGYTLFNPLGSKVTYLVDPRGRLAHTWTSKYTPGAIADLLPNGNLLRAGNVGNTKFAPGRGGIVEEIDWQGKVVWSFTYASANYILHHDVERLPNGNTLMITWEAKTRAQALAAGRHPDLLNGPELWPDNIIEVNNAGKIVWEWKTWDHLVQDYDPTKANYGVVGQHPELIDMNFEENNGLDDWMHSNSIAYNASLDQIMLSVRHFNEFWVIDHSTTTAQAASHKGGRSGKGGDLLYRWGNPKTYRAGTKADQRLWWQHDCDWIAPGLPGAGNIMIFNNGVKRPGASVSTVDELTPPTVDAKGNYPRPSKAWGPTSLVWTWPQPLKPEFYAPFVSGAQRLPNGNTLITQGQEGRFFEVTKAGAIVWDYQNPVTPLGPVQQGEFSFPTPGGTSVFRARRFAASDPALAKRTLTATLPVETYPTAILANGSTIPLPAKVGSKVALRLVSKNDAGKTHVLGVSLTPGLTPFDSRFLRVAPDSLLWASLVGQMGPIFPGGIGTFDKSGISNATILIPDLAFLAGLKMHAMFLVVDPAARNNIGTISNTVVVELIK